MSMYGLTRKPYRKKYQFGQPMYVYILHVDTWKFSSNEICLVANLGLQHFVFQTLEAWNHVECATFRVGLVEPKLFPK